MSTGRYESKPQRKQLEAAHLCRFGEHGLSYQTCRFCHAGVEKFRDVGLYKYAVRHYICPECREKALSRAEAALKAAKGES